MSPLEKNIISLYKDKGKVWLLDLPKVVDKISADWRLSNLRPVKNLSYNYVLSGWKHTKPIILKLSPDIHGLKQEVLALKGFSGFGAVNVLAQRDGALLLERAVPGISLKEYFPQKDTRTIKIACDVMKKLHQAPIPKEDFPHIRDGLIILDKNWDIPVRYLKKARELRDNLLKMSGSPVLLHGDLHHDNILQDGNDWMAIDPKGVIGCPIH